MDTYDKSSKSIDWLELKWEELNKKRLRKYTNNNREVAIALNQGSSLHYGDILYEDDDSIIAIRTELEQVLVIKPSNMKEMGKIAFEIGNRHTPCIIQDYEILIRYDHTFEKVLREVGIGYETTKRRFTKPFKYHGHQH